MTKDEEILIDELEEHVGNGIIAKWQPALSMFGLMDKRSKVKLAILLEKHYERDGNLDKLKDLIEIIKSDMRKAVDKRIEEFVI